MINSNCVTDTDLVHISRDCKDYKTTFEQLQYDVTDFGHLPKLPLKDGPMPWDDIPPGYGRFHIKNIKAGDGPGDVDFYIYLYDNRDPKRLYDIDGNRLPPFKFLVGRGEYVLISTGKSAFSNSTASWEFGELTDTSGLIDATQMFNKCGNGFDQDLSGWCVPLIQDPEQYKDVFLGSIMESSPEKHPVWGTCPGGDS